MTTDKQAMLPFRDIIINLTKALSGMNGLGQMRALQDLMNERGLKAAVAGIQGYIAEQKNLGLSSEETVLSLGKLAQQIEDAPGTMAVAAAAMATTSKNLMTGVKTALESRLVENLRRTAAGAGARRPDSAEDVPVGGVQGCAWHPG